VEAYRAPGLERSIFCSALASGITGANTAVRSSRPAAAELAGCARHSYPSRSCRDALTGDTACLLAPEISKHCLCRTGW